MKTTIISRNLADRTVQVRFEHAGVTHERSVNGCFNGTDYDDEATEARVAEVAMGVACKIEVGAIVNAPEPEVLEAVTED